MFFVDQQGTIIIITCNGYAVLPAAALAAQDVQASPAPAQALSLSPLEPAAENCPPVLPEEGPGGVAEVVGI